MDFKLVMLDGMVLTMGLLGLALAVAWARFGRETHVAFWSAAFFAAAASNLARVVVLSLPAVERIASLVAVGCSLLCASLLSQGFRKRAGLEEWRGVATVSILMFLLMTMTVLRQSAVFQDRVLANTCTAVLLLFSAQALRRDPYGREGAGRASFWMVAAFAGYVGGLAVLALFARQGGPVPTAVYDLAMLLGAPAALSGLGLFTMLLVASDLSARLQRLASLDPLTGVLNRRGFDHAAEQMLARCRRSHRPFAIIVADLDRFKSINDRFGHALGDLVLQRFAAHCEASVGEGDPVGRLGGEEFVIVLADADPRAAVEAIDRMRQGIPGALADLGLPVSVTASFGIATLDVRDESLSSMLVRADAALYGSKLDGRDRVTVATTERPGGTDPRFLAAFEASEDEPRPVVPRGYSEASMCSAELTSNAPGFSTNNRFTTPSSTSMA
ncbi:diguanylate cyclase [Sphingomonas sp.]|uniref:GGDEF domain-containing protein n=1 Tax=Sphingomonas sp. TaxID=28214 RepID=UPI003AFF6262